MSLDDLFYLPRRTEDNWGFKRLLRSGLPGTFVDLWVNLERVEE